MAIRILSSESISGFLTINTNDASGNRIGFKGDGATTGTAIHTNWTTGNSYLDFRLGGESDVYTKMRINNNGNVDIAGNLNLSVASSFITTSAGDLYLNPASNNTTLYDGTNAQIFNVYNAGNLSIKLDSASGTYGGVLLNLAGTNFVHGVSGQGLVLSHHNIGASNAIVSGDASNPDNLYINNGGAANDWSNVIIEGNVGIGAAPNTKLEVRGGSGSGEIAHATFTATANRGLKISTTDSPFGQNSGTVIFNAQDNEGYSQQWFQIGGATKMIINNSGRVGIAITPSAWGVDALQVGQASISQDINSVYVGANTYNSPAGWKRINAQLAGYMRMGTNDGIWSFSNGVTGTADSVIAWDERMRIDSAGNVGIGTTSPSAPLDVWGSGADGTALLRLTGSAGSQAFNWISSVVYPNLASGKTAIKLFGHSQGLNNQAYVGFKYAGSGSTNNTLTFGFYANNFLVNLLANGNFGIGTESPLTTLDLGNNTGQKFYVYSNAGVRSGMGIDLSGSSRELSIFHTSSNNIDGDISLGLRNETSGQYVERMRVQGNGNVGIGTTSPLKLLTVKKATSTTTIATSEVIRLAGTAQAVGNKNELGFANYDNNYNASVVIGAEIMSTAAYLKQDLYFATRDSTSDIAPTERMRITAAGSVVLKSGVNLFLESLSGTGNTWNFNSYSNGQLFLQQGAISNLGVFDGTSGTYTAMSDINKKKDFEDSEIGLKEVMGLKPKLYRMKTHSEDSDKLLGFLAQEVKEFIPQAYVESGADDNKFIGLTEMPIIAALTKAIQELKAEIELLKNK